MVGDKLFKTGGWSSKKFSGILLIISAITMGFIALLNSSIIISEAVLLIGVFLSSGLAALGIDAYNKRTHLRNKDNEED